MKLTYMKKTSREALDLFKKEKISWIVDQLIASFSEGIASSAEDASPIHGDISIESVKLSSSERTKRKKYETSRPYDEHEKLDLIKFALHEVFLNLPALKMSADKSLKELGATADKIEFLAPDEEEHPDNHTDIIGMYKEMDINDREQGFKKFSESLSV